MRKNGAMVLCVSSNVLFMENNISMYSFSKLVWILFHILLSFSSLNQCCSYRFCRDVLGCRDIDIGTSGARFDKHLVSGKKVCLSTILLSGLVLPCVGPDIILIMEDNQQNVIFINVVFKMCWMCLNVAENVKRD